VGAGEVVVVEEELAGVPVPVLVVVAVAVAVTMVVASAAPVEVMSVVAVLERAVDDPSLVLLLVVLVAELEGSGDDTVT
jgi:hypothetical protein